MPLRAVKITLDDDTSYETNVAANLTDQEIRDYFVVGMQLNVGNGPHDLIKTIKQVEILK